MGDADGPGGGATPGDRDDGPERPPGSDGEDPPMWDPDRSRSTGSPSARSGGSQSVSTSATTSPSVSVSAYSVGIGGRAEVSVSAGGVDRIVLDALWTDWELVRTVEDGGAVTDRVTDDGELVFEWSSVQSDVSLLVVLSFPDRYDGGDYVVDCRGEDSTAGATATGSVTFPITESKYHAQSLFYDFSDPDIHRKTSKHFQIIWGPNTPSYFDESFVEGNLRNLERVRETFVEELGFHEPSVDFISPDGRRYKTNVYVSESGLPKSSHDGGAFQGDHDGFAYVVVYPAAMRVDPPSWTTAHEFGHALHVHQKGGWTGNRYSGPWWESIAEWFSEQFITSDNYEYGGTEYGPSTGFYGPYLRFSHLFGAHGRDYYDCWPLFQYLHENPEGFDHYGAEFIPKLLQDSSDDHNPYQMIDNLAPGVSLQETLGHWAKRMATGDFQYRELYRRKTDQRIHGDRTAEYQVYTELEPVPDRDDWWRVPFEHAPMQGGFNIVELDPAGSTITVELDGIAGRSDAGWRAALVARESDGTTRYSGLTASGGTASLGVGSAEACYLTVVATPDRMLDVSAFETEAEKPYDGAPAKAQFPYEVKLSGATPARTTSAPPGVSGSAHPNGGGFVADSATVADSAYVGPNAVVLGTATVQGNARIRDYAVVRDDATVEDDARVIEHGLVGDSAVVRDRAVVKGTAVLFGGAVVEGSAVVDGDFTADLTVDSGTVFGWLPDPDVVDGRPAHPDVHTQYTFAESHDAFAVDTYGVNHGILRGDPDTSGGSLSLNGTDQYVLLPDCVLDYDDLRIETSVVWNGGTSGQRLWALGSAADSRLSLTPDDGSGTVALHLEQGGTVETVTTSASLPTGTPTTVDVRIEGGTATVSVDGSTVGSDPVSTTPEELRSTDTGTEPHRNALGRGVVDSAPTFDGEVESFTIYRPPL